jgi:hypothetical protein
MWDASGPEGPGLYATADVMGPYREAVDELAPHIGVSIRAFAQAREGTVDGRTGPVVEALTEGISIDFVTRPGAGGQVLQLFEAARRRPVPAEEADVKELEEARQQLADERTTREAADQRAARAEEALLRRAAGDIVADRLKAARVPEAAAKRLTERLVTNPPLAEGKLDEPALKRQVDEAVKDENDYLASLGVGQIRGFGGQPAGDAPDTAALQNVFQRLGLGESAAKTAAAGRV